MGQYQGEGAAPELIKAAICNASEVESCGPPKWVINKAPEPLRVRVLCFKRLWLLFVF